jgi:transposase
LSSESKVDAHGRVVRKKMLKRSRVLVYFSNLPQCRVGMEACASAHHWARELGALRHEVRLVPPQHVKPYVRGNKNDYNDALAIAEAVMRPQMRFVEIKTEAQQDIQALHRLRERRVQERTALCNQLRGLLAEYGLILPKGISAMRSSIPVFVTGRHGEWPE